MSDFGGMIATGTPELITARTARATVESLYTGINWEENRGCASSVGVSTPFAQRT